MPVQKTKAKSTTTEEASITSTTSLTNLHQTNTTGGPRVIYWFRTDLRLHDSPALAHAISLNPSVLYPIWTWDPHYIYRARVGPNRFSFLLDCQRDLSASLTRLNPQQKLLVIREAPQTLFPKLFKEWGISHLVFETDTDAYARERDERVMGAAKEVGVQCVAVSGRTLYDSYELIKKNGGKGTFSISQVQSAGTRLGPIPRPIPAPTSLPPPGNTTISSSHSPPSPHPDYNSGNRYTPESTYTSLTGPNNDFSPPTLTELGIRTPHNPPPHRGGETLALETLSAIFARKEYAATFSKPATAPTAFEPAATTVLSPHLHFGSLSVREFYWRAQDLVDEWDADPKHKAIKASKPPTSLTGQLLFRDMYFGAQAALGYKFGQAFSNPACRFIPWHLPSRIDEKSGLITGEYDVDSLEAERYFKRWKYGRTGFPWIDALMRQLRYEGWIHHLGRHAVACFLTRGGCYVDWERGAEVFEEWLVDHEAASNIGNWQWLACVAFYSQFYRCYSPIAFPAKWDPEGTFVRRYVPEVRLFDKKYIYEPWKAPIADAKGWGCLIKGDGMQELEKECPGEAPLREGEGGGEQGMMVYPKPMFDFAVQREKCIQGLKKAYQVGLKGADRRVLDGTWRALFADEAEGPTRGLGGPPGAMVGVDYDRDGAGGGEVNGHEDYGGIGAGHVGGDTLQRSAASASQGRKHKRGQQSTLDGIVKRVKK